jgi:GntR family transcriptional regulator
MAGLRIDPSDATPIWSQIEEGLRRLVASGALGPGAVVPSVRDLARELRVNPATVAKA